MLAESMQAVDAGFRTEKPYGSRVLVNIWVVFCCVM